MYKSRKCLFALPFTITKIDVCIIISMLTYSSLGKIPKMIYVKMKMSPIYTKLRGIKTRHTNTEAKRNWAFP